MFSANLETGHFRTHMLYGLSCTIAKDAVVQGNQLTMPVFKIDGTTVRQLPAKRLGLERPLQQLFEANLQEILGIIFLAHEYTTSFGGRIDTLCIDADGSPCIINYKKNRDDNVIDRGHSSLRWLLNHKVDFESLCHKKKIGVDIDWDSPRIICIAERYYKADIDIADKLPAKAELLRYRVYNEHILLVEPETYQNPKSETKL